MADIELLWCIAVFVINQTHSTKVSDLGHTCWNVANMIQHSCFLRLCEYLAQSPQSEQAFQSCLELESLSSEREEQVSICFFGPMVCALSTQKQVKQ